MRSHPNETVQNLGVLTPRAPERTAGPPLGDSVIPLKRPVGGWHQRRVGGGAEEGDGGVIGRDRLAAGQFARTVVKVVGAGNGPVARIKAATAA